MNLSPRSKIFQGKSSKHIDYFAILATCIFFITGVVTLNNYGFTWDEGLGDAFFGERYLRFFSSLNPIYLQFNKDFSQLTNLPVDFSINAWRSSPFIFPPFSGLPSAVTMYLFSYKLKLLDPIDGFHLSTIVIFTLFLIVLYYFFKPRLGQLPAIFGMIALSSFPRIWGDMHFNIKDVPETVFFGLSILSYLYWWENPNWKRAIYFGLMFSFAFLTKVNSFFIPFILILGVWVLPIPKVLHGRKIFFFAQHSIMVITAFIVTVISWPYLWINKSGFSQFVFSFLGQGNRVGNKYFQLEPIKLALGVMPEYFLILLFIGLGYSIYQAVKFQSLLHKLLVIWFIFPILRISMPFMVNFDGIRHYMEFLPAAAIISGIGFTSILTFLSRFKSIIYKSITIFLLLAVYSNLFVIYSRYSQYEYLYYNSIIGGLNGAKKLFGDDFASDYWGSSYRKGFEWINLHAEPGAFLFVPVANHISLITDKVWIRNDIIVINQEKNYTNVNGPTYIMILNRPNFFGEEENKLTNYSQPVFNIQVDKVPILFIYKLSHFDYSPNNKLWQKDE